MSGEVIGICKQPVEWSLAKATSDLVANTGAFNKTVSVVASWMAEVLEFIGASSKETLLAAELSHQAAAFSALPATIGHAAEVYVAGGALAKEVTWTNGARLATSLVSVVSNSLEWVIVVAKAGVLALSSSHMYCCRVVRYSATVVNDVIKGAQSIKKAADAKMFGAKWWEVAKNVSAFVFHGTSLTVTALSLFIHPMIILSLATVYTVTNVVLHYVKSRETREEERAIWDANHKIIK